MLPDVVMVYLLGVVMVSMRFGYGPSLLAAILSVVAYDFFFIPPFFSFAVSDLRHMVTFAVMFIVAVVISHLTQRIRDQADSAREGERRTSSLYAVSRELGVAHGRDRLLEIADRHLREVFAAKVAVMMPAAEGMLEAVLAEAGTLDPADKDLGVAEWVVAKPAPRGIGTDTLPSARALFVPLKGSRGRVGVLALYPSAQTRLREPDERQLLDTFAGSSLGARAHAARRRGARGARTNRDRAASQLAPIVRVARSANAARRGHRGHELAPRRARPPRSGGAPRAASNRARGIATPQSSGP